MIVIVGCGKIAHQHISRLKGRSSLGFFSRSPDTAMAFSEKYNGHLFRRYEDVLADSKVTALWITSPPDTHKGYLLQALGKNLAVFCEKPLCTTPADLNEIISCASKFPNARIMVGENYLYKPALIQIKKWLAQGDLGAIRSVTIKKEFTQGSRTWKAGLGALLEGGIHFVSFLNELLSPAPVIIDQAHFVNSNPGIDRRAHIVAHTQEGTKIVLRYSWDSPALLKGLFQHSRIDCQHGSIVFESNGLYAAKVMGLKTKWQMFANDVAGFGGMTDDFFKCLEPGAWAPVSNLQKAKRDLDFVFDAYRLAGPLKTS